MPSHDPFSPASAVVPPTDDVTPRKDIAEPDFSVLQPDEVKEARGGTPDSTSSPGTTAPQEKPGVPVSDESTNDATTATASVPETSAEGPQTSNAEPAPEPDTKATPEPELQVKAGTAKEVMDWVNEVAGADRTARAQAALDVERKSDEPRKGLSHELEELLNADAGNSGS